MLFRSDEFPTGASLLNFIFTCFTICVKSNVLVDSDGVNDRYPQIKSLCIYFYHCSCTDMKMIIYHMKIRVVPRYLR